MKKILKGIKTVLIILGAAVAGAAGYYGYRKFIRQ